MMRMKNGVIVLLVVLLVMVIATMVAADTECYTYTSSGQSTCESNNCTWETEGSNSWCQGVDCYIADGTNQTYCEQLNVTYNIAFNCEWSASNSLCNPFGGDFHGDQCSDFNNNSNECYETYYCVYNTTSGACGEPAGWSSEELAFGNPACSILVDQPTCGNVTGCTWNTTSLACNGNVNGMECVDLNQTLCPTFTLLSTCCVWNSTSCSTSFSQECYNNIPAMPIGATFCEDSKAFKNKTLCNQISGSPWYMPCKFNESGKNECHFNSAGFGGGASSTFDEIGTELGCEAQGGIWKSQQYEGGGVTKTDSWCEFNFGGGGNCDSSCWACEVGLLSSAYGGSNTTSQAQTRCESSDLGYCSFQSDSFASNGLGWCNPKNEFVEAGGKSCDDKCASCEFLTNPESQCNASAKGCTWSADTLAPNGAGFCYGKSEKYCGNDCWSCYTQSDCVANGDGGNGACNWDPSGLFCKKSGFTGEVCFDGKDNDADTKIDCQDSDCATDKFCGGADLGESFGSDCPSFSSQGNTSCIDAGCVWIQDSFDAQFGTDTFTDVGVTGAGFCDYPGAQCWQQDDNSSGCNATVGCSFINSAAGFCDGNETLFDACFTAQNSTGCTALPGCGWAVDTYMTQGGRCEPLVFAQCFGNTTRHQNQTACEQNATVKSLSTQICSWSANTFAPNGGYCDPVCFGLAGNAAACETPSRGLCEVQSGYCEPDSFGGKCIQFDGNKTYCTGALNSTCTWFDDTQANNNVSLAETAGWCDSKSAGHFISYMGDEPIVVFGTDESETTVPDTHDLKDIGLKDTFDKYILGANVVDNFNNSAACNGVPTFSTGNPGVGKLNYTFFWYLDSDGDSTNRCAARDNSSVSGFEFSFKYSVKHNGLAVIPGGVAYQCVNGSWGAVPIPLMAAEQTMCDVIGGGMGGIDKSEMFKFKSLFNKSEDLRWYVTVSNTTSNDSFVSDTAGPYFYTQGSFDFEFEDCSNPGADADGDGLKASNDPDCFDFLKFGFKPNEAGYQCGDGIDNDGDGLTDCADAGCTYDPFTCGATLAADPNDKTAPKVVWMQVDAFTDSAFVMYDTSEPANGTLTYYYNESTCKTTNTTIRDVGITDTFVSTYKMWHDAPVDNFNFNPESIGHELNNATTYFFKTKVCDISGNCAVSACKNFTTKSSLAKCNACNTTFNFPFDAPTGSSTSDPLGNLQFSFELQDGTEAVLNPNSASGKQFNHKQAKNFNLVIKNPNATSDTAWEIKLVNASVLGKVAKGAQNFSAAGGDMLFNTTSNDTFVGKYIGLGNTKCQELINVFRPKKLDIGLPGNVSELWQCTSGLKNCTDKSSNATKIRYNTTSNITTWRVPAAWGC